MMIFTSRERVRVCVREGRREGKNRMRDTETERKKRDNFFYLIWVDRRPAGVVNLKKENIL